MRLQATKGLPTPTIAKSVFSTAGQAVGVKDAIASNQRLVYNGASQGCLPQRASTPLR